MWMNKIVLDLGTRVFKVGKEGFPIKYSAWLQGAKIFVTTHDIKLRSKQLNT